MTAQEILKDLVAFDTLEDKENHEIMAYIDNFLSNLGFKVEHLTNAKTGKEVIIGKYGEEPAIGFLGHTDTVNVKNGWETEPRTLTEKDGNLYGLGACDMKGGIAAFLEAIQETDLSKLNKGIAVYCTYDEELMFEGVYDLVNAGTKFPPHVIIAEPTDLVPAIGSKGLIEYIITFHGTASHSSTPIDGRNSNKNAVRFINRMLDFEEEIRKTPHDFFGVPYTTMNVGYINGGSAMNTVADKTTVYMDFRVCDSENEHEKIKKFFDDTLKDYDADYECINDVRSFQNKSELVEVYEKFTGNKGVPFFGITEASFFEGDRVIIGPGPVTAHEPNEHITIESLLKTVELYKEMIQRLCL